MTKAVEAMVQALETISANLTDNPRELAHEALKAFAARTPLDRDEALVEWCCGLEPIYGLIPGHLLVRNILRFVEKRLFGPNWKPGAGKGEG